MENRYESLIERYKALKDKVVSRKQDFERLMEFVENETSYMECPASTHYHLCKEYGLLEHSINVAENLLKIKNALAADISDESCVIVALLHDLGKAGVLGKLSIKRMKIQRSRGHHTIIKGKKHAYIW